MTESQGRFQDCLEAVKPDDVRFGFPSTAGRCLAEAILLNAGDPQVRRSVKLLRASMRRTFAADMLHLSQVMARLRFERYPASIPNATHVFAQRFGAVPGGTEFSEIGASLGRTKQRAAMLLKATLEPLKTRSVFSSATEAVLIRLAPLVPIAPRRADEELVDVLGRSSTSDVLEFVRAVQGRAAPFELQKLRLVDDGTVFHTVLNRVDADNDQLRLVWRSAVDLCLATGCTQLARVAGVLQLEHELALTRDSLVSLLQQHPGFLWLDKKSGWLSLREGRSSVLENRVAKVFSVSPGPFRLQRLIEILAGDSILAQHADAGLPPGTVLDALFSSWDWLQRSVGPSFSRTRSIDQTVALSDVERLMAAEIAKCGGSASLESMRQRAIDELGVTNDAVWRAIQTSLIFKREGRATYTLIDR